MADISSYLYHFFTIETKNIFWSAYVYVKRETRKYIKLNIESIEYIYIVRI